MWDNLKMNFLMVLKPCGEPEIVFEDQRRQTTQNSMASCCLELCVSGEAQRREAVVQARLLDTAKFMPFAALTETENTNFGSSTTRNE
jgi:hypothetical protein